MSILLYFRLIGIAWREPRIDRVGRQYESHSLAVSSTSRAYFGEKVMGHPHAVYVLNLAYLARS